MTSIGLMSIGLMSTWGTNVKININKREEYRREKFTNRGTNVGRREER